MSHDPDCNPLPQRLENATEPEILITDHGMAKVLISRVDAHTIW